MAVREFDGTDDQLSRTVGALSAMTHGTIVTMVRRLSLGSDQSMFVLRGSGGERRLSHNFRNSDHWNWYPGFGASDSQGQSMTNTTDWFIGVARKDTGTSPLRYSVLDMSTGTWSHTAGTASLPDSTAPGASGTIRFSISTASELLHGRIAIQAAWSNALGPSDAWTLDASGDAAIEAAGLETSAQNWLDQSPDAMWRFNQAATTTAVVDDTGNGADETSIVGTTVITGDDPPGFDFSLGVDLDGADTTQAQTASSPALTQVHELQPASATHGQTADAVTLTQTHELAAADATQTQTADQVAVVEGVTLTPAGTVHGQTATTVTLAQVHELTAANAEQGQSADAVALTQLHELVAASATHAQAATSPAVTPPDPADLNPIILSPYRETALSAFRETALTAYQEGP